MPLSLTQIKDLLAPVRTEQEDKRKSAQEAEPAPAPTEQIPGTVEPG